MSEVYATHIEKLSELLSEERIEEALDYIETIPADVRSHWEIENMTGVISCYCGMFEEAVGFFKRALQGNPNSAEIYYNLSYAYINMQDFAQAELMLSCCEHNTDDEDELIKIMQRYGAYNAANLDGGNSSALVINNELINHPINWDNMEETRPIATGFILVN